MSLLVTGSIGLDTVETPKGKAKDVLGGSAVYFSLAASLFTEVRMIGVVGEDFELELLGPLCAKGVDTSGVEIRRGSKTFRWQGKYEGAMGEAETVNVQLNVLGEEGAEIPEKFQNTDFVFLANTHPALQSRLAEQFSDAKLIVADTMNLWIETELPALKKMLKVVHGLVLNEGEARMLTKEANLVTAGRQILELGPKFVIIKKGENGSLLVSPDDLFTLPAYATENVVDPTGCGDCFAGAMMGYLAKHDRTDKEALRAAMARGTVVASYVLESFSVDALSQIDADKVEQRLAELTEMSRVC